MDTPDDGDFRERLLKANANADSIARQFALAVNGVMRAAINGSEKKYDALQHLKFMFDLVERTEEQISLGTLADAAVDEMRLGPSCAAPIDCSIDHVVHAALKYYLELIANDNAAAGRRSKRLEGLVQAIDIYNEFRLERRGRHL